MGGRVAARRRLREGGLGPQEKRVALPSSQQGCQWGVRAYGPSAIYRFPSAKRPAKETCWQDDKSCRSQPSLAAFLGLHHPPPAQVRRR